jgi:galactokinase
MECGFGFAIAELNGLNIPKSDLIIMAQWAEHNYAGVKCGIMDQFASMMGEEERVVMLDCRSLDYTYYPLKLSDHSIVLCNTHVKHSLVDSEYNTRRHECETGVSILQRHDASIKSLRDASPAMIIKYQSELPGKVFNRCLYITQEIQRVREASLDLQRGDITAFGKKMYETHEGLSRLYEVSCAELDFLVDQATKHHVVGSRMMGGGFGGCTINIIPHADVDDFIKSAGEAYHNKFDLQMDAYHVSIKGGTSKVLMEEKISIQ